MFIKHARVALCAAVVLNQLPLLAHAESTFNNEVRGLYVKSKTENNDKLVGAGIGFKHYFSAIDTTEIPFMEADFFGRSHGAEIALLSYDSDTDDGVLDYKAGSELVGITLASPNSPFTASVHYQQADLHYKIFANDSSKLQFYKANLGWYINETLLVAALYEYRNSKIDIPELALNDELSERTYGVGIKQVAKLFNDHDVNLEFLYQRSRRDDEDKHSTTFDIQGDYYFTQRTSLGGRINVAEDGDTSDNTNTYGVKINHYLNPSFAVGAAWEKAFSDSEDETTLTLMLTARF